MSSSPMSLAVFGTCRAIEASVAKRLGSRRLEMSVVGLGPAADTNQLAFKPEAGHLISYRAADGRLVIGNTLLQETLTLSHQRAELELFEADDGYCFVAPKDDESNVSGFWLRKLFRFSVAVKGGVEFVINRISGEQVPLNMFFAAHHDSTIGVRDRRGGLKRLTAAVFKHKQAGCRVWLSADSLYEVSGMTAKDGKKRWVHHCLLRWEKSCEQLGLEDLHVRRSRVTGRHNQNAPASPQRILEYVSLSSIMALVQLCKWSALSAPLGGLADPRDVQAMQATLAGLLARLTGSSFEFDLIVPGPATWKPPLDLSGAGRSIKVTFDADAGRLRYPDLVEYLQLIGGSPVTIACMSEWQEIQISGFMVNMCVRACSSKPDPLMAEIWRQFVIQLGLVLDLRLASEVADNIRGKAPPPHIEGDQEMAAAPEQSDCANQEAVMRYWWAARTKCARDMQVFSITTDGSTIGRTKLQVSFLGVEGGVVIACPPQAPHVCDTSESLRRLRSVLGFPGGIGGIGQPRIGGVGVHFSRNCRQKSNPHPRPARGCRTTGFGAPGPRISAHKFRL